MILRKLNVFDEESFLNAVASWSHDPQFRFLGGYEEGMKYSDYLTKLDNQENGINLPEGWVPDTSYFGFLPNGEIVGRLYVRHELTEFLNRIGGHIGYGVLEKHRNNGYATSMLKQSLKLVKGLGINKALVTCDDTNAASAKVIERCGGLLENKVEQEGDLPPKRRYWIEV